MADGGDAILIFILIAFLYAMQWLDHHKGQR